LGSVNCTAILAFIDTPPQVSYVYIIFWAKNEAWRAVYLPGRFYEHSKAYTEVRVLYNTPKDNKVIQLKIVGYKRTNQGQPSVEMCRGLLSGTYFTCCADATCRKKGVSELSV
jgi:hypothetical protein